MNAPIYKQLEIIETIIPAERALTVYVPPHPLQRLYSHIEASVLKIDAVGLSMTSWVISFVILGAAGYLLVVGGTEVISFAVAALLRDVDWREVIRYEIGWVRIYAASLLFRTIWE